MTPQQIDAMKLALEALEYLGTMHFQHTGEALYQETFTAIEDALKEHAMRETPRLGQEIEQVPCVHAKNPKGCYRVRCQVGDKCVDDEMSFRTAPPQRTEQEPVVREQLLHLVDAYVEASAKCDHILEHYAQTEFQIAQAKADLAKARTTFKSSIVALLSAAPPQRKPLTNGEIYTAYITATNQTLRAQDERLALAFARAIEAAHGIKGDA